MCRTNIQIEFKPSMLTSILCDYSDAYIVVSGTITTVGAGADTAAIGADKNNKKAIFKNFAPFTNCITEISNTQVDNTKDWDAVMPMYNLIEYSNEYSKTTVSLHQFCRSEPNDDIRESESFKSKFLDNTNNVGIKNAKIH